MARTILVLEPDDIIEPDDWVKDIYPISSVTQFDSLTADSDARTWARAKWGCPAWVGTPAANVMEFKLRNGYSAGLVVIRGELPPGFIERAEPDAKTKELYAHILGSRRTTQC